jgi:hypothetical protein
MRVWIRQIAQFVGLSGACVTLVVGALLGLTVPTLVLRAAVVGVALGFGVLILGRLVGDAILHAAVEHYVERQTRNLAEPEPRPAAKPERNIDRTKRAA